MADNGRDELARRLRRVFLTNADTGKPPAEAVLRAFADDILAGDYVDHNHGPRAGDGGPPMRLVPEERSEP